VKKPSEGDKKKYGKAKEGCLFLTRPTVGLVVVFFFLSFFFFLFIIVVRPKFASSRVTIVPSCWF